MGDNLGSDDIVRAIEAPSSEFDQNMDGVSDDGWGSNVNSEMDDTDDDPDFNPSDDSEAGSAIDDNEVGFIESMNGTDEMIDSLSENMTVVSESDDVNIEMEDYTINLGEKFKCLKTKNEKLKMKKDELDKWQPFEGKQKNIVFEGSSRFAFGLPQNAKPEEYFYAFLTDDLIEMMVDETNRNADQVISTLRLNRSSRLRKWRPTYPNEMKKFLGLLLWMGLVPMPRLTDYWSKNLLYKNVVAGKVMSRNRFQLLLRFWHFNDNLNMERDGRLGKISPLIKILNKSFKTNKTPGEDVVIDESMIPFRGRLLFRQYLPNKTHKYGIKVFKICDTAGYTYKMKVYMGAGTGTEDNLTLAASVVMDLMRDYLDRGHTLYVDNFYTSVDLAHMLLARNTHLVGSVISNRAWFPHKKTIGTNSDDPLKKGEMRCLEYPSGIVYTKWFDKREVRMMSTKHPPDYVDTGKKTRQGEPILKPLVIVEYNKAKMGIDVSDQMSSYSTAIRKSMRWYHKVAEEFLLGTAVVNAWLAYKDAAGVNSQSKNKHLYSITTFREKIVYALLGLQDGQIEPVKHVGHHHLSETVIFVGEGKNKRRARKNCKVCYARASRTGDRKITKNLKKITTFCESCPGKPFLCKDCFKNLHK